MDKLKYTKNQIKEIIPHRDPFLLIDEIIDGNLGKDVTAIKNVTIDDYFFKGHFPKKPIMPGVLILECMAQASCFLQFNVVDNPKEKMMLLSMVNQAKFIKKVVPGNKLIIYVELIRYRLGSARIKGNAKVNGDVVARADFMATVVNKND
jgi:3-hydroxyacyl-[acyl-carrier-protein] dehydratase